MIDQSHKEEEKSITTSEITEEDKSEPKSDKISSSYKSKKSSSDHKSDESQNSSRNSTGSIENNSESDQGNSSNSSNTPKNKKTSNVSETSVNSPAKQESLQLIVSKSVEENEKKSKEDYYPNVELKKSSKSKDFLTGGNHNSDASSQPH